MAGRVLVAMCALLLAGCSSDDADALPAACLGEPALITQALARAPQRVTLAGDTRLSTCVSRARSDGDLQALGVSLTQVADDLRARVPAQPQAAVALGYLAGAVRSGADASSGLAIELARRIERASALDSGTAPAARAARERGLRAGERGG